MSRRRAAIVAFALVASLLVTTAPAAAGHQLATAGRHTTASDFNAGTLTGVLAVSGTGSAASVIHNPANIVDDFEDNDLGEYTGATGSYTTQGTTVQEGSFALEYTASTRQEISSSSGLNDYPAAGDDFLFFVRLDTADSDALIYFFNGPSGNDDGYAVRLQDGSNNFQLLELNSDSGSSMDTAAQNFPNDEWLRVEVNTTAGGGAITATVFDSSGTQLAQVSGSDSTHTSGGIGFEALDSDGSVFVDNYHIAGTGSLPGTYTSANVSAEQSKQGWVNVTQASNVSYNATFEGWDGSSWNTLNETTGLTGTGNQTFTWSQASETKVRTVVEVSSTGANEAFELADDGVQFTANTTGVDNFSATPTGGVSTSTPTLEIDINDSDYPLSQGDSVDVEFFVDGSSVGTDTLTSNGTASHTLSSSLSGGDHTWHVVANDSYGHSVTSSTFSISAPGNVTIRNVTEPHDIITSAQAEVLIAGSGETVDEQTVTDGNISLVGLPTDETYVIVVDAEGYHVRSAVVTNIFDQSSIFLLNDTNKPSVETTFEIEDPTGELEDPLLIIERSINRSQYDSSASGTYQWTTIGGSRLSATGTLTIVLEQDALYRLEIRDDGIVYELGEHPASSAGTFTLVPVEPTLNSSDPETDIEYAVFRDSDSIHINFDDPTTNTSSLEVFIHERGNESNTLQPNETYTDLGTLVLEEPLSAAEQNTSWTVVLNYTHDGQQYIVRETLGGASVDTVPVELSPMWLQIAAVTMLVLFAGVFSIHTRGMGAFAVAGMGGVLWYIGWLDPIASGASVSLALGIGVLVALSQGGQ